MNTFTASSTLCKGHTCSGLQWVYICKLNIISDLISIIPGIQHPLFGVVIDLSDVSIVVDERQVRDHLSVSVGVKGVGQICVLLIVAICRIKNAAYDEAIAVAIASKPGPPRGFTLHA